VETKEGLACPAVLRKQPAFDLKMIGFWRNYEN